MPYIPKDRRAELAAGEPPATAGDLAYAITRQVDAWLERRGHPRFSDYATATGVLECVKQEFYRRSIGPYEDRKRIENGEALTIHDGRS